MSRILGLMFVLWACCSASATTLQQLSIEEMTENSTAIVRARVTSSSASFTGSTIYTHYKLDITETWKGAPATEVMLPGGVTAGFRQSFPGVPQLQVGSEYVLFLWTSAAGITHLVGLSQGVFDLSAQSDGSMLVSRPEIGETILDSAGRQVKDRAIRMRFADMKARVDQNVGAGAARARVPK